VDYGVPSLLGKNPPVSPFMKGGKEGGFVAAERSSAKASRRASGGKSPWVPLYERGRNIRGGF